MNGFEEDSVLYEEISNRFGGGDAPDSVMEVPTQPEPVAYDANRSVVMKQMPQYLEDMRYSDPQGTIDYLFSRKNKYKTTAYREFGRANQADTEIQTLKQRVVKFRRKAEGEKQDAKWWKNAFWIQTGIFAGLLFAALMIALIPKESKTQKVGPTRPSSVPDLQEDRHPQKGGKQSKVSGRPE